VLAYDFASPFIWAGAVAFVALLTWILQTAFKSGIGDIVAREVQPLHTRLEKHLEDEERALERIDEQLTRINDRNVGEHDRIWDAIEDLRRKV